MKISMLLFVGIGLLLFSAMPYAGETKKDVDKIQGLWAAATYVQDGESEKIDPKKPLILLVFMGEKITILSDVEETSAKGTFKLDSAKKPKTIDINLPPAVGAKKGQTIHGIYEIEGDTLKICYGPDGVARPTEFNSKPGSKLFLIGFKQLKK